MTDVPKQIDSRDLGASTNCIGAEAALYENGEVEIRASEFEGEALCEIVFDRDQAKALLIWLSTREEVTGPRPG